MRHLTSDYLNFCHEHDLDPQSIGAKARYNIILREAWLAR